MVAERGKTYNGVAEADGSAQQVADVAVAALGTGTYGFRVDVATAAPVTRLAANMKVNGSVILGGIVASLHSDDRERTRVNTTSRTQAPSNRPAARHVALREEAEFERRLQLHRQRVLRRPSR